MTTRIIETTAPVKRETVAPRTELFWEPTTNEGRVVFHMQEIMTIDGVETARVSTGRLERDFASMATRTFSVPDGHGGTIEVPMLLVMATMKQAFDEFHNEDFAPSPEEPADDE